MLVSVIIPNYNHAQFLKERIESVLNQTYQNIELIILDDFSSDQSRNVIELFRDNLRVAHIVFNDHNSGSTFKQWKKGLDLASGEWIWIAESDDYCGDNFLECLIPPSDSDNCGLRFCSSISVNEKSERIGVSEVPLSIKKNQLGIEFLGNHLLFGNCISNASSVLIRKDVLTKVLQGDVMTYKLLGDWLVWVRACCETDVYYIDSPLNFHRQHSQTVRYRLRKAGMYNEEFAAFRKDVRDSLAKSEIECRNILIEKNRMAHSNELGLLGCQLIREKQFISGILLVLKATVISNFELYYLRSAAYWILKGT